MAPSASTRSTRPKNNRRSGDPWQLVWGQPFIDSDRLAAALEDDLRHTPNPDVRTRLLVRDAARALRAHWGARRFTRWLAENPAGECVRRILQEPLGAAGFPHLRSRLVTNVSATQIKQIFDLLGQRIDDRLDVTIAGSIPTLIEGLTAQPTTDIDLVNEVPAAIRQQRALLQRIQADYGLRLGHVRTHFLPEHWDERRRYFGDFGGLRVYLMDPYDIFVSKLSSKQEKHRQDIRVLAEKLDPKLARRRLLTAGRLFLEDTHLRSQIEANWRFIYQEPLAAEGRALEPPRKTRKRRRE